MYYKRLFKMNGKRDNFINTNRFMPVKFYKNTLKAF